MNDFVIACGSCLMAGILTTLHPCPLSTNIASVSFLTGMTANRKRITSVILSFIGGYLFSYLLLGIMISSGFLSVSLISIKLQNNISLLLGPFLILIGMLQADFFQLKQFYQGRLATYLQSRKWTGLQVFPFGALVALSFCPATAAIFFGLLIPLAIKYEQMVLFPLIYALGAALPIIAISILISRGAGLNARARWITLIPVISGWILIIVGVYLSIKRIYSG